ncbi:MAG: SPFH domain-containing protein [Thermoflexales bacterium]|nr:SPFH domain-containing protein [Thermoflexales bacterium]
MDESYQPSFAVKDKDEWEQEFDHVSDGWGAAEWVLVPLLALAVLSTVLELGLHEWCVDAACLNALPPLIMRDMLPGVLARLALLFLAANFVRAVYGLKTLDDGMEFVQARLLGYSMLASRAVIKEGKHALAGDEVVARVGGPGRLIIHNDSAVVLEQVGQLTRVLKTGRHPLRPFEKIYDIVDLRPQRWVHEVEAMSKDGIPVNCQVDITFQIDDGGRRISQDEPFPATEQAILRAAADKRVRQTGQNRIHPVADWTRRAAETSEETLRDILATYLLDQLIGPAEPYMDHRRAEILSRLRAELRQPFSQLGLKLNRVELGEITVADEVLQNRIEAWRTLWKRWARGREAAGEAEKLQYIEAAKAQAQADMIAVITQAFQSLTESDITIPSQLVLLRMFEVLKRTSFDPHSGMIFLPTEIMHTWQLVQDMFLDKPALPGIEEGTHEPK